MGVTGLPDKTAGGTTTVLNIEEKPMSAASTPAGSTAVNTADLYDERGDELASVSLQFQSLGGRSHFSGRARTIRCFQDNALVKATLATPDTAM